MGSKTNSKTGKGSKQNGSKSNGGKLQTQERQAGKEQTVDRQTDFSMLRKPIEISVTGVAQVVKVYQTATAEVRQLLAYECDLVYECKVCRNLFRSLANFLSHKRVYCKDQFCDTKHVFPSNHLVEDQTTVIQPEPIPPGPCKETWITNEATPDLSSMTDLAVGIEDSSAPRIISSVPRIATFSNSKRDLSQIVEKLAQKRGIKTITETIGHISASNFYESVSDQVTGKREARKEHMIRLEAMENTKFGVYQTVLQSSSSLQMENTDLMKAQVIELHDMMNRNEATLDPDGQIAIINGEGTTHLTIRASNEGTSSPTKKQAAQNNKLSSNENHVCTICNTRFSTRKTLNHHMKSLHVTFRMCYPCPCCKNTFCNTWSVYRHLYKVHRKTTLQVRKLRSQIVNKAFRKEISVYDSQSSNAKSSANIVQTAADKARKEQQRLHQENQAWMNNFEDDLELQMCGGCGRRFERRAALNSHSQICQKRIAIQNNTKSRRISPINTTSNRSVNSKVSPISTDRQQSPRMENVKNEISPNDNYSNRLTPLSVQSESISFSSSGTKGIITPSPSPIPLDISGSLHTSPSSASYHRTRHCSGNRVENTKKDVPEKRIEIQIRRDYCKAGTGAQISVTGIGSSLYQHQDCSSETNDSPIFDDDVGEGNNNQDDASSYAEEDGTSSNRIFHSKEYDAVASADDHHILFEKLDENISIDNNTFKKPDNDEVEENKHDSANKELNLNESSTAEADNSDIKTNVNEEDKKPNKQSLAVSKTYNRITRQNSANQNNTVHSGKDKFIKGNLPVFKMGENYPSSSPIMENRMKKLINVQRLQCLPCQRKYNKMTNLRRHVAVHIGWNRYRCTECNFKCYSKCDCVAHVIKMHLQTPSREKAQSMVQYIEIEEHEQEVNSLDNDDADNKIDKGEKENTSFKNILNKTDDTQNCSHSRRNSLQSNLSEWSVIDSANENNTIGIYSSLDNMSSGAEDSLLKVEAAEKETDIDANVKHDENLLGDSVKTETIFNKVTKELKNSVTLSEVEELKVSFSPLRLRSNKRLVSSDSLDLKQAEEDMPAKKRLMGEEDQEGKSETPSEKDVEENVTHNFEAAELEMDAETPTCSPQPDENLSSEQEETPSKDQISPTQTELRKMVMEVIFGTGNSNANRDFEAAQNLFAAAMNGDHGSEGSISSPEPYEVVENFSSDSTSPLTTNSSEAGSPVFSSDDASSVMTDQSPIKDEMKTKKLGSNSDIERRQRPVRNRIRVEREDFIYDLSDKCLDPKRDVEDRSSKTLRRKPDERPQDMKLSDKGSSGESLLIKTVPKLMLMRTNASEYSSVKIKSGSSSNVTQVFDSAVAKNNLSNSLGYNISTRKSQRTLNISPHKVPGSNKEKND